ncbi:hypothetical protein V5799_018083 [Amblyomma americanum]|uniref:Uncharacterized protein n=1 Tax=Amblyomma americanum TaxID=6943 RepID=A0AAQ4F0H0_AMBAM
MHVLCWCCYEQCTQDGTHECPLDGSGYEEDDVNMFDFPADDLLRREVKCWNEDSGCQYTTAASGITQHFLLECEHHSVRCPKCSATVLCRDVCTHLRSASCNTSTPVASESQVPVSQVNEAASLTSFKEALERQAGEITAYLRPMAVDMSTHGDRLSEISHGINTLKETLRQELTSLLGQNHEEITSSNAELKQCFATCSDTVKTCLRSLKSLEKKLNDELGGTRADLSQIAASIEQVKD